jgi:N-methylhydantoinase A
MYGYIAHEEPIQLVTFRVEATGRVPKSEIRPVTLGDRAGDPSPTGHRNVWLSESGGWTQTALYDRAALSPGDWIEGPAIVEQMDSTTLILPGQIATTDAFANIIIEEIS